MFLRALLAALARRGPPTPNAPPTVKTTLAPAPGTAAFLNGLPREPTAQAILDAAKTGEIDDPLAAFQALSVTEQLKLIEAEVAGLPDHEKRLVMGVLAKDLAKPWLPMPGPQSEAMTTKADLLLYGGQAGGGKSDLLIGVASQYHRNGIIFRRQSVELDGLIQRSREMLAKHGDYRGAPDMEWTLSSGAKLRFGGLKEIDDWRKYAGRGRDFIGFDEGAEFLEEQVMALQGWLRSTDPRQRCRVILASNPPRGAEGEWINRWFAPWLDDNFANPAAPGELRWCVHVDKDIVWIDDPRFDDIGRCQPVLIEGEEYTPTSRTFIPARLDDNPYLSRTNYRAQLQKLPEPLRSQLLKGDFLAGRRDDDWQVIPTAWIKAAQARWTPLPPQGKPMTSMGVDLAYGGSDKTILAPRHGNWFAPLKELTVDTKDGAAVAGQIFMTMRDGCEIVVDVGGGFAGGPLEHFAAQSIEISKCNFGSSAEGKSREGLSFINRRAELYWRFREGLDPESNSYIALPPDPELPADLSAPRWKQRLGGGIQIESKDDIRKRLGRSPDRADAVVMAWAYGDFRAEQKAGTRRMQSHANVGYADRKSYAHSGAMQSSANLGYSHVKRR